MAYIRTEGVILSHKNFSEADHLLTIFTRDKGKISCIAKGARRPRSRKSGHVQLGNWCKIFVAIGKNIDILTEVETKRPFGFEKLSPAKAVQIYHLLELTESLTETHQKNIAIFSLLVNFLKKINNDENFNLISTVFKVKLLSNLGFFSAKNLTDSRLKDFFQTIEVEDPDIISKNLKLTPENYLKVLAFLDSIIENLAQRKLKTSRFVASYG